MPSTKIEFQELKHLITTIVGRELTKLESLEINLAVLELIKKECEKTGKAILNA